MCNPKINFGLTLTRVVDTSIALVEMPPLKITCRNAIFLLYFERVQ